MKTRSNNLITPLLLSLVFVGFFLLLPTILNAQTPVDYKLLSPLPLEGAGGPVSQTTNSQTYLIGLFKLAIGVAGALAVIMIMIGGFQYITAEAFSGKSNAKEIIQNAIWGLLLAISAWIILYTINPKLVEIKFDIKPQPLATTTPGTGPGFEDGEIPVGYEQVRVSHKQPMLTPNECGRPGGCGCAYPGPCVVMAQLNTKLDNLAKTSSFYVTEMFPPTRAHRNACHSNGSCVDATIPSATEANIKKFIEESDKAGLDAQFETTTEKRAADIRKATGLGTNKVYYVSGITGEHFSLYNK